MAEKTTLKKLIDDINHQIQVLEQDNQIYHSNIEKNTKALKQLEQILIKLTR